MNFSVPTRPRRLRLLSINRLLPNIITVMAFCSGVSALRFALDAKWELAVSMILLASVLDALDGRMARLLKAQSKFGAELDSLSDLVCFGVAPAVVLFMWSTIDLSKYGWMAVLLFGTCCILRLARFNVALDDETHRPHQGYFTGVPAPAGAGLALLPMIVDFHFELGLRQEPGALSLWLAAVGLLMASSIPTYAFKQILVPQKMALPILLAAGLLVAGLVSAPWLILTLVLACYMATLPFSVMSYRREMRLPPGG